LRERSPEPVRRALRLLLVVLPRIYFRYIPISFGRRALWDRVAEHTWWLESDAVRARTAFGCTMRVSARDVIGKYIYYFGVWEPNLTSWLTLRLMPGDVFVDIGAYVGYYSLLASHLVGEKGRVVAIEPLPQVFHMLEANLAANLVRNVRTVNIAVWDTHQNELEMFTDEDSLSGRTTLMSEWADHWQLRTRSTVRGRPLPAILTGDEMRTARIVKIDVEGAEAHVTAGMEPLLVEGRSDLEVVLEVSPQVLEAQGMSSKKLLELFGRHGFFAYRIDNFYSPEVYVDRHSPTRPVRITEIPSDRRQTDVIFSRVDELAL
jgi:FkbM family methyltransferase